MVYISTDGNQNFNWIIIISLMASLIVISVGVLYFHRKIKYLEAKITKRPKAPMGQTVSKFRKKGSTESFEIEAQIKNLPIVEEEKKVMLTELHGIENDESIDVVNTISGNLSEIEAEILWNSLFLRFNRLYKSENWAQALFLLESLYEIAEFLGDHNKFKDFAVKYNEKQGKQQQKFSENQIN